MFLFDDHTVILATNCTVWTQWFKSVGHGYIWSLKAQCSLLSSFVVVSLYYSYALISTKVVQFVINLIWFHISKG